MQNQSGYTVSVENTGYFPVKGPQLTENRALTMEGEERFIKKNNPSNLQSCGTTLIL